MILNVAVDGQNVDINVPDTMLSEAREFFDKMDADLDKGYQMGRYWVENPNPEERCQIAADRLVTAIENENRNMATMMSAYILSKAPHIESVVIDSSDEIQEIHFL
ncbi:MAG: hypothetical protein OEY78_03585 [Gammaproteobacteria bacterium]|nr:hypothetical protein [Gammaproteobacteria bacterium]